jgi:NDP-sugar pyrophosphorylase family protein
MLFAAGLGTRLKPFTDFHPKALALVNGQPLLGHNLKYLNKHGIEKVIINIHHFGNQIIDYIKNNNFGLEIIISDETNEVLETGGGLVKAKDLLGDSPFLVMNVDILTNLDLFKFIDFYQTKKPLVALAVSERKSARQLFFDDKNQLKGWKNFSTNEVIGEINNHKPLAFSGIHIINPAIFNYLPRHGKFSITTSYLELMSTHQILGFDHSGDRLIDVGKPEAIAEAEKFFF